MVSGEIRKITILNEDGEVLDELIVNTGDFRNPEKALIEFDLINGNIN
jgi:hypothetical protein